MDKTGLYKSIFKKYSITLGFFLLVSIKSNAQFFPKPTYVNNAQRAALLAGLKADTTAAHRLPLLLALGSLYYHLPFKNAKNTADGIACATTAETLSTRTKNEPAYEKACFLEASLRIQDHQYRPAEQLLTKVAGLTKLDLFLSLSYNFNGNDLKYINNAKTIAYADSAAKLAKKLRQPLKVIEAGLDRSFAFTQKDDSSEETQMRQAVGQYKKIGYPKLQYAYYQLCYLDYVKGKFDKATYYAVESIKIAEATRDTLNQGDFYLMLALVYRNTGQTEKAVGLCQQAIQHFVRYQGLYDIPNVANFECNCLRKLDKYREALFFIQHARFTWPPQNELETSYYDQATGECYKELKEYDLAERYLVNAFNYTVKTNEANYGDYRVMGQFYVEKKDYKKAAPYLQKVLSYPAGVVSKGALSHVHYMMYLVDSAAGNYKEALYHFGINKVMDNAIYSNERDANAKRLSVQYETDKKDQRISFLDKIATLQAEKAKEAILARNITIGIILLTIFGAVVVYWQYLQKKKANELISQKNNMLEHLVTEKEWLLKEVHHRVKNNLHTVISLLESQAAYLHDDALTANEESQHRIFAMSLIHQKLYLSEDIKLIDMSLYLAEFVGYLSKSFDSARQVRFELDVEAISLDVAHAMPLALIVNEAITNSIKHAFPGNRHGAIAVSLNEEGDDITLKITDNGVGIPANSEKYRKDSLGIKLMKGLSGDIHGEISILNDNGTAIAVVFKNIPLY